MDVCVCEMSDGRIRVMNEIGVMKGLSDVCVGVCVGQVCVGESEMRYLRYQSNMK